MRAMMRAVVLAFLVVPTVALLIHSSSEQRKLTKDTPKITQELLANLEKKYGGFVNDVNASNPHFEGGQRKNHWGGDRFGDQSNGNKNMHNYASFYVKHLNWLVSRVPQPNVMEVGILAGSGIAIWSELFPESHIYGFDIDISNTLGRQEFLISKGFHPKNVMLASFDQMKVDSMRVRTVIGDDTLSFVVDDGCHTPVCALNTWRSVSPQLSGTFVYIIEDGACDQHVKDTIMKENPDLKMDVTKSERQNADGGYHDIVAFTRENAEPAPKIHMSIYKA